MDGCNCFLFGAKATQSYFENADKINTHSIPNRSSLDEKGLGISQIAIAQIAEASNKTKLKAMFSNILEISSTLTKEGKSCVAIYLKDVNREGNSFNFKGSVK
ncbi:MAG: hypothetical protein IPO63_12750 [Bacteroidetes bacterium]|nr:hypothetical protein [Bacteroidota bacterium]